VPKETEKISFEDFKASYHGFHFDDALLYIDFRRVELDAPKWRSRSNDAGSEAGVGRKDMESFFKWLQEKGVRNIIKVIVEDRFGVAHSDVSIEKALQNFDIEILDWRKIDLCPRTIREGCKNSVLQEIHLWWSGNNGMLRSWSEPDGLVKLTRLKAIHLHEPKVSTVYAF
jgi:hypothetical protein